MSKKKSKPSLITIVNDWLKKNRPELFVDEHGDIGLLEEKGMRSKAFGTVYYGGVGSTYVEFLTSRDEHLQTGKFTIIVKAADPQFFEKLAERLK